MGTAPEFDASEASFEVVLEDGAHQFISDLLCDEPREKLSMGQMFYVANRSPDTLGVFAREIYEWLGGIRCKGFVPIYNCNMVCS